MTEKQAWQLEDWRWGISWSTQLFACIFFSFLFDSHCFLTRWWAISGSRERKGVIVYGLQSLQSTHLTWRESSRQNREACSDECRSPTCRDPRMLILWNPYKSWKLHGTGFGHHPDSAKAWCFAYFVSTLFLYICCQIWCQILRQVGLWESRSSRVSSWGQAG